MTDHATCPSCGSMVDRIAAIIDLDAGTLAFGGKMARLTPQEARIAQFLLAAYPGYRSRGALYEALFFDLPDADWPEMSFVDVLIFRVRAKIKPLGLSIETIWSRGWSIRAQDNTNLSALRAQARQSASRRAST